MAKLTKPPTKSELLSCLAEDAGITRKQAGAVLAGLTCCCEKSLKDCGKFILPGLLKVQKKKVPARKAQTGVPNPFKPGETMNVAARPAYEKVVVRALKSLKAMA